MKFQDIIAIGFLATVAWAGSEVVKRSQVQKLEQSPEAPLAKRAAEPNFPRAQPWRKVWERSEDKEEDHEEPDFLAAGPKRGENRYGRQLWRLESGEVFASLLKAASKL